MIKKRLCTALLCCVMLLTLLPAVALAAEEQFSLTAGETYYFDLSGENIPGTPNEGNYYTKQCLPDTTLHYVPFTYVGEINAYKYTSKTNKQEASKHSLFIADYVVTYKVSWDALNEMGLIFGKPYSSGGVKYTMRAPSVGSKWEGSTLDTGYVAPRNNEWDMILNKNSENSENSGYIKNWSKMASIGQDRSSTNASCCVLRGYDSDSSFRNTNDTSFGSDYFGFRPVLEISNPADLRVVTLSLNGGAIGSIFDEIKIVVKKDSAFTAPSLESLMALPGHSTTGWEGSDGKTYAPGDENVPAEVTKLTAQFTPNTYTVTLHTNGGTIAEGKDVTKYTYGTGATLPTEADIARTGYTFGGWYGNEELTGDPVTAIGKNYGDDRTYWAKWTPTTYKITYNLDGGTAEGNPDEYTIETEGFTLVNPTKSGYTFTGWSGTGLEGEENMTVTIEKGSTGDRTYTAHWRADSKYYYQRQPQETAPVSSPKTADGSAMGLWSFLLCASLGLIAVQLRRRKKGGC